MSGIPGTIFIHLVILVDIIVVPNSRTIVPPAVVSLRWITSTIAPCRCSSRRCTRRIMSKYRGNLPRSAFGPVPEGTGQNGEEEASHLKQTRLLLLADTVIT